MARAYSLTPRVWANLEKGLIRGGELRILGNCKGGKMARISLRDLAPVPLLQGVGG